MNLFDSIQSVQTLAQQIWFVTFPLAPRCQTSDNTRFWDPKATKTQKDKVFLTAHHSKKALQVCSLLVFVFQLLFTCFWFIVMVVFFFDVFCSMVSSFFQRSPPSRNRRKNIQKNMVWLVLRYFLFLLIVVFWQFLPPLLVCVYCVGLPGSFFHMVHFLSFFSVFFHCVSLKKPLPI